MATGRQASFAQVGWEGGARYTRRARFPGWTGSVLWADLLALAGPPRPTADRFCGSEG